MSESEVAEQPVFWLGGTPGSGKEKGRQAPEAERYEPAIRDACAACGFDMDEYVAAQGGFGGWLAHLLREDQRFRIFWSGKDQQLTLEQALEQGGWQPLDAVSLADEGLPVFVESVKQLLANRSVST